VLESDNELGLIEIGNGLANVANVACLPRPAACHLPDGRNTSDSGIHSCN